MAWTRARNRDNECTEPSGTVFVTRKSTQRIVRLWTLTPRNETKSLRSTAVNLAMIRKPIESIQGYLLDRMVLRPSRHPIEFAPQERVMLDGGKIPIECFVQTNYDIQTATPEVLILKYPGTAGRGERSSPFPMSMMASLRVATWTWNPPGYGRSQGSASLRRIGPAAIEFWRQVKELYPAQTPTWLCGNSLGCVSVLHVASSIQPDPQRCGMVLRNPPPLKPVVKRVARRYPMGAWVGTVANRLCDSMNAMSTAPRCSIPAVFLQSELDSLVPVSYQNRVIRSYQGPVQKVLLEGLEHGGIATEFHQPRIEQSIRWLQSITITETDRR